MSRWNIVIYGEMGPLIPGIFRSLAEYDIYFGSPDRPYILNLGSKTILGSGCAKHESA